MKRMTLAAFKNIVRLATLASNNGSWAGIVDPTQLPRLKKRAWSFYQQLGNDALGIPAEVCVTPEVEQDTRMETLVLLRTIAARCDVLIAEQAHLATDELRPKSDCPRCQGHGKAVFYHVEGGRCFRCNTKPSNAAVMRTAALKQPHLVLSF